MSIEGEHGRLSDSEILDMAESWILSEARRCQRKLAITPLQLFQVMFRVTGKVSKSFIESVQESDDEDQS